MLYPEDYSIAISLFLKGIGFIYFFAFGAFLFQIKGLIGSEGILPIKRYLSLVEQYARKSRFYFAPSLFWINSSDFALMGLTALGTFLSFLLFLGFYPVILLPLLYILYLSIVSVGQDFLSFGWEMFFLEITFQAFFLSLDPTNVWIWMSINLLLFRFHFQGGMVKLQSRDPNWRNLTAIGYHYQSQPIPNTQAWYVYKLPLWFQKFSTALMFFIEIPVPFFIFVNNEEIRLIVFALFFGLQLFIWMTGNFSYLNHLTAVFCILLVSNTYLSPLFSVPVISEPSLFLHAFVSLVGIIFIALQLMNLWNHFYPHPLFGTIMYKLQPFHIVNRYGIFAVMTTERDEVIIEGSQDGVTWKEYGFYYKPSEVNRRPRRISPYQPRIDWQIWFLPFKYYASEAWFQNFLYRLLLGSKEVLSLIRVNPFSEKPPLFIRAQLYKYEFTDFKTKKETGAWWKRTLIGPYSPTLTLKK